MSGLDSFNKVPLLPVEHGVESSNFIHTHRRNFKQTSNFIHDRDGCKTVLSLAQIQKRHDSSLLVLRRILLQDLFNTLLVVGIEFKGNIGIVLGCIAMLKDSNGV